MTAVMKLPTLRERQARKLHTAEEEKEEIDLVDVPNDLVAIGSPDLIVAWLLKQGMREGEDSEPPVSQ